MRFKGPCIFANIFIKMPEIMIEALLTLVTLGDLTQIELVLIGVVSIKAGNTKGGSITVPLTSCLTGLESAA